MTDSPKLPQLAVSPLVEPPPVSLDELFSRDPLGYTQRDIATIVGEFRRQRAVWEKSQSEAAAKPRKGAKAASAKTTLGDLGLED